MKALQTHFRDKRDYVLGRLTEMGFKMPYVPNSTFYIWLDLSNLPEGINDGLNFFNACLKEKVIVVPGLSFVSLDFLLRYNAQQLTKTSGFEP